VSLGANTTHFRTATEYTNRRNGLQWGPDRSKRPGARGRRGVVRGFGVMAYSIVRVTATLSRVAFE